MNKIIPFLAIIITGALVYPCCSSNTSTHSNNQPLLELKVSQLHREHLAFMKKEKYAGKDILPLFSKMAESGNRYCEYFWRRSSFNRQKAEKFFTPEKVDFYRRLRCKECMYALLSGCFNFFTMNDIRPDRDFKLVKKLYPAPCYQCYSVGFIQPYMMHAVLNCSEINVIDVDWRIHYAHAQMLEKMKEKQVTSPQKIDDVLSSLDIGWIAHSKNIGERQSSSIKSLCYRQEEMPAEGPPYSICKNVFMEFQKTFSEIKRVRLVLSRLHDAAFTKTPGKAVKVFYLSNAIEDIYTTRGQFRRFMKNIADSMREGEKAVLIHHAGGRHQFGIYELTRRGKGYTLHTRCRDPYPNTVRARNSRYYKTYFEGASKNSRYPSCIKMLKMAKETRGAENEQKD